MGKRILGCVLSSVLAMATCILTFQLVGDKTPHVGVVLAAGFFGSLFYGFLNYLHQWTNDSGSNTGV